jgi:hypothetical protein
VRLPGGRGRRAAKPANQVITDLGPSQLDEVGALFAESERGPAAPPQRCPSASASACIAYREAIESGLSRGRNAMAIWQDLVDEYSFASSYQSVQRFVRKLRETQTPEARVVIVTAPGQEAQVDYGTRREHMEFLVTVPLLIIDDLGMPKLPSCRSRRRGTAGDHHAPLRTSQHHADLQTARSKTGASCWATRPPSAPCSTACCTTDTCSTVRGAGEPRPTCHHKRPQGRTI